MEHLVESHHGGYYVSDADPEFIERPCEICGDNDWIILSWEEGKKFEEVEEYFSTVKVSLDRINSYLAEYGSKDLLLKDLLYKYECDRELIHFLCELGIIPKEEEIKLLLINSLSQQEHVEFVENVFDGIEEKGSELIRSLKNKNK